MTTPQPQSPPAPKKKNRPTLEEHEERIELVVKLMVILARKWEIKRGLELRYGKIAPRTVERYMARARERLREFEGKSKEELFAESVQYYAGVLKSTDPKVTTRDKMVARERLDDLFGLKHAVRHEITGADGGPIKTAMTFSDFMEQIEQKEATENRMRALDVSALPITVIPDSGNGTNGNGKH